MTSTIQWSTLRRSIVVAGIAGLTLIGASGPAGAQTYPPSASATFSDATPGAGQTVAVSGNAVAGTTVSITLARPDGTIITLGTTIAGASGAFNLNILLPSDLANGNYVLAAVNGTTILSSAAFAVSGATTQGGASSTGGDAAAPAQTTTTTLPVTGNESGLMVWGGAGFVVLGGAALTVGRLRVSVRIR